MKAFGKAFKSLLSEYEYDGVPLSQYRLSKATGIPKQTINWYIQTNTIPPYKRLQQIAQFLGFRDIDQFMDTLEKMGES